MSRASADFSQRRVLVTGATGMVGSALAHELLDSGAYVAALVLDADPQTELYRSGDVNDVAVVSGALEDLGTLERALRLHGIDTVFHLGAQTIVGAAHHAPFYTFEANIRGTYNLLEACRRHADLVRCVVVASSDKAYGNQALPYTEDAPLLGRHPYEVSKSCADMLAQCYHHTYGLPVAIARCGNIYGPGDCNWSRIVPGTIRDFLRGRRPVIRSDGASVRDYLYVKDAVSAYLSLAGGVARDDVAGQAFNFGDDAPATVLEMVATLQRLMECEHLSPDVRNETRGEIQNQSVSSSKARRVLGWDAVHARDEALTETISWYRTYLSANRVKP
ncbi:MAG: GDP-mannose 4,6-dehydratase [Vicinamibacterales bacterium]